MTAVCGLSKRSTKRRLGVQLNVDSTYWLVVSVTTEHVIIQMLIMLLQYMNTVLRYKVIL